MKTKLRLTLMMFALMLSACSKHWRDSDSGIADADLSTKVQDSLALAVSSAVGPDDVTRFNNLLNDPNTGIYYAESGGSMGPADSVASFVDWSFMGAQTAQLINGSTNFPDQLDSVRVIFLDQATDHGDQNALLIDITSQGTRTVKIFFNDFQSVGTGLSPTSIDQGEFVSPMVASDGAQIIVHSFDVTGDLLQGVIQLEVDELDPASGDEVIAGKFTTLVGFLP